MDRRFLASLLIGCFLCGVLWSQQEARNDADPMADAAPQRAEKIVLIRFGNPEKPQEISPLSEAFFNRKFEQAKRLGADVLVVEIDSPGGYVDSSIKMASALRDADWATTVAYIPREALSGAAIMSLGCDQIVMGKNAYIGDAGPIFLADDFLFRHAPEKIRSDLVAKVRSLAETTGRPPAVAEAMVDMDLEVFKVTHADSGEVSYMSDAELKALDDPTEWRKGALLEESKEGQFLEVVGSRAVEIGLADVEAGSRRQLAAIFGRDANDIVVLDSTWVDTVVTVLNFRFVTLLLVVLGLIAVYMELAAPGIGIGALVAGLCFGLFFWSRFLGGTAGWLEVLLFLGGVIFVLMEIFVIPGFGIAGLTGVALMGVALLMAGSRFAGADGVSTSDLTMSLLVLSGAAVGSLLGMFALSHYFGSFKLLKRLTLEPPTPVVATVETLATGHKEPDSHTVAIGDEGIADSPLKPSGRVLFGEVYHDVVTDGSFVDKGARVKVIKVSGTHITVRQLDPHPG